MYKSAVKALFISLLSVGLAARAAATEGESASGLLWDVQGTWQHEDGKELKTGDAIKPGELLRPTMPDSAHQAIALLPDGQRLFYQCFGSEDCARGFRVPLLNASPSAFAVDMLNRLRAEQEPPRLPKEEPYAAHTVPPVHDEMVATLTPAGKVHLTGLAATLPPGAYTYDLIRIGKTVALSEATTQYHLPLTKTSGPADLSLPGPGLYEIHIADTSNRQRIRLLLLATAASDTARAERFTHAKATLREWNEKIGGWPTHPLLQLYLLSLADDGKLK